MRSCQRRWIARTQFTSVRPPWESHPGCGCEQGGIGLLLGVAGYLAVAVSGSFVWNAAISAVARLLVYAVTSLAVLRLRREGASAFVVPTPVHLAAVLFCAWLFTHQTPGEALAVGIVVAAASLTWLGYRTFGGRSRAPLTKTPRDS